jgi:hypothetical protein
LLPHQSESAFRRFLASRSIDVGSASSRQLIEAALDFYVQIPAQELAAIAERDMLLFQFGTYNWGNGEHFEIDVTRQFIIADAEDDDAISQLNCTLQYKPTDALRSVGNGNRWCKSREGVANFRAFILASDAYLTTAALSSVKRTIRWSPI